MSLHDCMIIAFFYSSHIVFTGGKNKLEVVVHKPVFTRVSTATLQTENVAEKSAASSQGDDVKTGFMDSLEENATWQH